MEKNTFILYKLEYNKEFVFLNDEKLRFKGKEFDIKKGFIELKIEQQFGIYKGKFIIFTTHKALQKLKENQTCETISNDKGIYVIESKDFRFINFNQVANVSKVKQIKDKYKISGEEDLELMENFIKFLEKLGASKRVLSTKWLTGIQREIFYKDLTEEDLNFKNNIYNLMRSSDKGKRKFVYEYLGRVETKRQI